MLYRCREEEVVCVDYFLPTCLSLLQIRQYELLCIGCWCDDWAGECCEMLEP